MATKDELGKLPNLSSTKQALLERLRKRTALTVVPAIPRHSNREKAPLSFAQQRLWLIQQLDPASYLYNVPRALHIRGPLEIHALEKALNSIIKRHEVLRTMFPSDENGQPWQKISRELKLDLAITDLKSVSSAGRNSAMQERVLDPVRSTRIEGRLGPGSSTDHDATST